MNEYGQVVTEDLAKSFVDHSGILARTEAVAKLALHHREGRFDVRPFVVALEEFVTLPHEEIKHVSPHLAFTGISAFRAVRFERDERHRSSLTNGDNAFGAQV